MGIVKEQGIDAEANRLKLLAKNEKRRFVTQREYIEDRVADVYHEVLECSTDCKVQWSQDRPGVRKVSLLRCGEVPWCVLCTATAEWKRVNNAVRALVRTTPAGKNPRFTHMFMTAPHPGPDAEDWDGAWGKEACQDPKWFKRVVFETIKEAYDLDVGAVMAYQDFGEHAFAKRHPHCDFVVNGWALNDGVVKATPVLWMKGGGRERLQETLLQKVRKKVPEATQGNYHTKRTYMGKGFLRESLKYSVREMVDIRKMEYKRDRQVVYWKNYKENRQVKMTVLEFEVGLAEYQARLKQWPSDGGPSAELVTRHGFMSDRRIGATQALVGGKDEWEHAEAWEKGYSVV